LDANGGKVSGHDLVEITVDISEFSGRKLRTPFSFHNMRLPQQKCGLHTPWVFTTCVFTIVSITSTAERVDELKAGQSEIRWVARQGRQLSRRADLKKSTGPARDG
jgi:hypothetical protein